MDYGQIGRQAATIPGQVGGLVRRAPRTLAEAAMMPFEPARAFGGGLAEAAQEFGAGFAGLPGRAEMEAQIPGMRPSPPPDSIAAAVARGADSGQAAGAPGPVRSLADAVRASDAGGVDDAPVRPVRQLVTGATPALEAGQFRGSDVPDWGIDVSAAQLEQDTKARGLLERANDARMRSIDQSEELRGDPLAKQIQARQGTLAYESLMPHGAASSIRATYGGDGPLAGSEISSDAIGDRQPGIPTIAQVIEQQNRVKPEDERRYQQDRAAGAEIEQLNRFSAQLAQAVGQGRITREAADAEFERARDAVAFRLQAVRGDTLAAWGPKTNPYEMGGGAPITVPGRG